MKTNQEHEIIPIQRKTHKEDFENVVKLGLYTASQSIATKELRTDSLQNIIGILAHAKFPAKKEELIQCAHDRNAEKEVIEFIKQLPLNDYHEISTVISTVIEKKINSTDLPKL